jgi:hypothetical protein
LAQTRDIVDGKGECALSYMMICVWWQHYPELAYFAIRQFVIGDRICDSDHKAHPYGCWKDIKYLCKYVVSYANCEHPIVDYCIQISVEQLRADLAHLESDTPISLCAKWMPRESSAFGWFFIRLARAYYPHYMITPQTPTQITRAERKARQGMRTILARLNRHLDTVQIKQCANTWDEIDHHKTTSVTLVKQRNAFLNISSKTRQSRSNEPHRIACATNFKNYINGQHDMGETIKGKRVSMVDFTKDAIKIKTQEYQSTFDDNILYDPIHKTALDSQWRDSSKDTKSLGNIIVMSDTSGSMSGDPLYVSISLGIRIAEKSCLGKRIMAFNSKPSWINLEPAGDSFVEMVHIMNTDETSHGLNTDFYAALDLLLSAIIEKRIDAEIVKQMALVILSDMQMDEGDQTWKDSLYDNIRNKYREAGIRSIGTHYDVPLIVFWNLRGTNGFPCLTKQKNVAMMSGFSPSLLNDFCQKGVAAFSEYENYTPYQHLLSSLSKERYECMETMALDVLTDTLVE